LQKQHNDVGDEGETTLIAMMTDVVVMMWIALVWTIVCLNVCILVYLSTAGFQWAATIMYRELRIEWRRGGDRMDATVKKRKKKRS
jgi:hypothetical protein